jgi:uncharacterized RDD family membrane protein YckC
VRTPEGVSFTLKLASPVLRGVALVIDVVAVSTAWSVLSVVISLLDLLSSDIAGTIHIIGFFLLSEGYRICAEWLWRGQSIGKKLLRLRVVDERGFRLSFAQIVLRNLLRFVDALPAFYLVGGLSALVTKRAQRVGDIAAGTLVVWEPAELTPDLTALRGEKYNSLRAHPSVVARLRQEVTPAEAHAAWQALARRDGLDDAERVALFAEMAAHFRAITPVPPEATEGVSDEQFLRNIVDALYLSRSST